MYVSQNRGEIMKVTVLQNIMNANDQIAARNLEILNRHQVIAINVMSSPGAGKTTLLLETIRRLKDTVRMAVIEADIASSIDADKISREGIPAIQINTGGQCHIDANMVGNALGELELNKLNLIFIENVGNLVCPAEFKIGTQKSIMLLSVPEGDDKPLKYPLMFSTVDAVLISKVDYLPLADFNVDQFSQTVKGMNSGAGIFCVSARSGVGIDQWIRWLKSLLQPVQIDKAEAPKL
jgi:hydrogenase nickel incorporation protein HypB